MKKLALPLLIRSYCQIQPANQKALQRFARALINAGRAPSTVQSYLSVLSRFARYVADLLSPQPEEIQAWLRRERRRLSISAYNQSLTAVRRFYQIMAAWEYTPVDHSHLLPVNLPRPQRLPRTLDTDQVAALLAAPDLSTYCGFRDHVVMALLHETGLRAREVVALRVTDLLADPAIYVRGHVPAPDRYQPISDVLWQLLQAYLRWRASLRPGKQSTLFLTQRRRPFAGALSIWCIVSTYAQAISLYRDASRSLTRGARLPGPSLATPRILRATYIAELLNRGVDIRTVQALAGHQSITSTLHYESLNLRALKAEHAKLFSPATQHPKEQDDDTTI